MKNKNLKKVYLITTMEDYQECALYIVEDLAIAEALRKDFGYMFEEKFINDLEDLRYRDGKFLKHYSIQMDRLGNYIYDEICGSFSKIDYESILFNPVRDKKPGYENCIGGWNMKVYISAFCFEKALAEVNRRRWYFLNNNLWAKSTLFRIKSRNEIVQVLP